MNRALWLCLLAACGSSANQGSDATRGSGGGGDGGGTSDGAQTVDARRADGGGGGDAPFKGDAGTPGARTVFVIPLENKDEVKVIGDTTDAPYINGLIGSNAIAAEATNFGDELAISVPSEPHYIWMEAGTNALSDHTFTTDDDVSMTNSTGSADHLVTQLGAHSRTWTAYQEGITTGDCPISSSGEYAAKHQPFAFFRDVSGSPPSASNAQCGAHFKSMADLAGDLSAGSMANYVFVTPNLCNDMHGDLGCASGLSDSANIAAGDAWLKANLPAIIAYTHTHDATIFLSWDEGESTRKIPFIALGTHVKAGVKSAIAYTHSSQLKTVEEILGVPILPAVSSATDLGALFDANYLTP